jgi:hypothetical protein
MGEGLGKKTPSLGGVPPGAKGLEITSHIPDSLKEVAGSEKRNICE